MVFATAVAVFAAVLVATTFKSLSLFSLSGATGVCVTCYVVPVACHWSIARDRDDKYADDLVMMKSSTTIARDILAPGLALCFGVSVSLLAVSLVLAQSIEASALWPKPDHT